MRLVATIILLTLLGCSEQVPEYVWVPGNAATETVAISASQIEISVNMPVILHASRNTSGYKKVRYSSLGKDACWWRSEPPAHEAEVADNLRWIVNPEGASRFNVEYRTDHTRMVTFTRPGKYRLYAESAMWCLPKTVSNTIEIIVTSGE